jgi:hypothetical protein
MSQSDRRLTPEWLLAPVREFFGGRIPLDPFTEAHNPTGATYFCCLGDPADDRSGGFHEPGSGLDAEWVAHLGTWAQPPFSIMRACVDKAITEARFGAEILFLSRADVRTKWFRQLADNCDARCNINRSVGFIEPLEDGTWKQMSGDFYGYSIWYFGRQRRRFTRIFSPLGEVIAGMGPLETADRHVTAPDEAP